MPHVSDGLLLAYIAVCFVLAGGVKGAAGIGLPTAAIVLMTLATTPRHAIALLLIPMLVTNAWQVYRMGHIGRTMRRYMVFTLALVVGVWLSVALSADAPDRLLFALLGVMVLAFVIASITRWAPNIPDRLDTSAQLGFGSIAGLVGGLTAVWAAPIVIYLSARNTAKDEFVRASGLLIFMGSVPLMAGYLREGLLDRDTAMISAAMLVPAMIGFALGERARAHLSEQGFRKMILVIFAIMGLNLLRKAVV